MRSVGEISGGRGQADSKPREKRTATRPAAPIPLKPDAAAEAARLARIIEDVLSAGQVESQTLRLTLESCDAGELAAEAVKAARLRLPVTARIEALLADPPPGRDGRPRPDGAGTRQPDRQRVKYSPPGEPVGVRVEAVDGAARLSVDDRSLGIPVAERYRVFDKFYRLDPEQTRGVGGTGLGLYICRELVGQMGGRIWVDARADGGSTFVVELPSAGGSGSPTSASNSPNASTTSGENVAGSTPAASA